MGPVLTGRSKMDAKTVDAAIAGAKADLEERQAEGMIVDAWGVMRAVLMRLPSAGAAVSPAPVMPAAAG